MLTGSSTQASAMHYLSIGTLGREQILNMIRLAVELKSAESMQRPLAGKYVAMLFEKPSLRTRMSFEIGVHRLGGHAIFLDHSQSPIGERESIEDLAAYLGRTVDAVVARVHTHSTLELLAACSSIPVINALSDIEHPCQAIADLLTINEHIGTLASTRLAYVGDGNNVCHSLMIAAAIVGMHMTVITPDNAQPSRTVTKRATDIAMLSGCSLRLTTDPNDIQTQDVVYTDTWVSMGSSKPKAQFEAYKVDKKLMALASNGLNCPALFMHCMPAHRGFEVDANVIDGNSSIVYDQAENRMHAQNALLTTLLTNQTEA